MNCLNYKNINYCLYGDYKARISIILHKIIFIIYIIEALFICNGCEVPNVEVPLNKTKIEVKSIFFLSRCTSTLQTSDSSHVYEKLKYQLNKSIYKNNKMHMLAFAKEVNIDCLAHLLSIIMLP